MHFFLFLFKINSDSRIFRVTNYLNSYSTIDFSSNSSQSASQKLIETIWNVCFVKTKKLSYILFFWKKVNDKSISFCFTWNWIDSRWIETLRLGTSKFRNCYPSVSFCWDICREAYTRFNIHYEKSVDELNNFSWTEIELS